MGLSRGIPKRVRTASTSSSESSRFFSDSGSMLGWMRYCGMGSRWANFSREKMAASYFTTNGRRNPQARRCGCETSMWHRHTHRPDRSTKSTRARGCGSCTSTTSASRSRREAFSRFTSTYVRSRASGRGCSCPWRALWRLLVTRKNSSGPEITSHRVRTPSSPSRGTYRCSISATPPPNRVEFTWTRVRPRTLSARRHKVSTAPWGATARYASRRAASTQASRKRSHRATSSPRSLSRLLKYGLVWRMAAARSGRPSSSSTQRTGFASCRSRATA
ncbi:hypothetical protein HRbin32_00574 [bacterium HR32]|nr:hypothetical protein HRbin32_00574 [bacterium HR32]